MNPVLEPELTPENLLLHASRNGMVGQVRDLIQARHEGSLSFDLNARGKSKSNCGWAALHLACYFGHGDVVGCLLQNGADINALNRAGDTPLHKSAFTGRVNIVMMLLHYNADVFQINGEGQTARDVASNQEVKHILQAAEQAELFAIEGRFLDAAREGNVDVLNSLLKSNHPPRLNCTDTSGNTALHCASYRDQKEVAVILLQNGLDTNILNNRGQAAMDLAHTPQMKQLLGVKPIKEIQKLVHRFEGPLARKSRVLGSWKQWWVVVERGVISYFNHRADGSSGIKRKHYKYMEDATINMKPGDDYAFVITFSDKSCHTLSVVPREEGQKVSRQRWINAVQLHICYSSNLVRRGGRYAGSDEDDEAGELQHLGSMQDALEIAVANHQVLEKQVADVCHLVEQSSVKAIMSNNTHVDVGTELSRMVGTSRQVLSSLSHCLAVCKQSEEIHRQHLKEAQEKSRVLEDALHALAKEHHELEHSLAMSVRSEGKQEFYSPFPSPQQYQSDDDDIFFDADDASSGDHSICNCEDDPTGSGSMGKASNGRTEGVGVACAAVQQHASVDWGGRKKLPAPAISRNNFSVWTFLKQCIGKELSKITMPVVFNEPLSFLQRLAEGMEYISLLDKACDCDDAVDRIQYVTAYYVSMVASSEGRFAKPFNPLLGETYELERLDNGFRVLLEQVSHHPPISALQAESTTGRYKLQGSVHPKLKFWGKSIEINPDGQLTIELTERNEVYQLNHVNCVVHNVIFGDMWIEQVGQLQVTNLRTRHKAALNFRPVGWFGKDLHKLDGYIYNERKEKRVALFGKWTSALYSADVKTYESYNSKKRDSHRHSKYSDESDSQIADIPQCPNAKLLWRRDPLPPNAEQAYLFSEFALTLNEFTDEMRAKLPQTDSRLRDDVRRLEHGDIDGAADNKLILEEKQRATRKLMHSNKEVWCNRWFKEGPNPHTGVPDWLPTERCYWDRDWSGCPDIF